MGEALRTAIGHESALLAVAQALAETRTSEEVARVAIGCAHQALGATSAVFYLVREGVLALSAHRGLEPEVARDYGRIGLDDRLPLSDAIRTGEAVWIESAEQLRERYPEVTDLAARAGGVRAVMALPLRIRGRTLGGMALAFAEPKVFDRHEQTFMLGLGSQCAIALDRAALFEANDAARERMTLLAELSARLSSALDFETARDAAAELLLGRFADWAILDLVDQDGELRRSLVAHVEPEKSEHAATLMRLPPEVPADARSVMAAAGAVLVRETRVPEGAAGDAWHAVSELGLTSYIQAPLLASSSALGALTFVRAKGAYTADDLIFAEEIARRVSIAFENARLFERAKERERRLRFALEAASMGAWEWDVGSGKVSWTESLERLHGLPPGGFGGRLQDVCDEIHPDDRPRVMAELERVLKSGSHYESSYRIIRPDRSLIWVEAQADVTREKSGRASKMVGVCRDVTRRKRAEEAVATSEQRFRAVFDRALDPMVLVDDDRCFVDVNSAACALLGRSKEELVGTNTKDVIASNANDPEANDLWRRFNAGGEQRGEIQLRRADGSSVSVEYSATAHILPGQNLAIWRDVEARRQAENRLRLLARAGTILTGSADQNTTLQSLADLAVPAIADFVAVDFIDEHGEVEHVAIAHADRAKLRATSARALTRWLIEETAPEEAFESRFVPDVDSLSAPAFASQAHLSALGVRSLIGVPLNVRGRTAGVVWLGVGGARRYSVEDLRLAEDLGRRASLFVESARSYREARDANRLKDDFLSTISHELRTPLNAILGWVGLLRGKKGSDPAALGRGLDVIERNALAQVRLIEDVLDVSRIVSGKLMLKLHKTDLSELVERVIASVAPSAAAKGVELSTDVEASIQLYGDADRLRQVTWNLLSNAVKFTPAGGTVEVSLKARGDWVTFGVHDTGQGVASEFLPFLFDRFRQADSSPTRRHGGLGLGLAITRHLVELHQGTIHAESEGSGLGSTFTVELPLRGTSRAGSEPPPAPQIEPVPESERLNASLRGLSVLVCDDEPDARELLANVLGERGARVTTVSNASEAFDAVSTLPDVLVSDIGMPGEDGYSLIQRIRALPRERGGQTPALALTAFARSEDSRRAVDAGYQMHLAKPARASDVIGAVAALAAIARDSRRSA
jgi:PAS domain S-box-containing protein